MHEGKVWEHGPSAKLFSNPETAELRNFIKVNIK
jgi:polar amino acid transport system ATP-binding protein